MAGYKGVGILFVRRLVREAGPDVEAAAIAGLTPDEVQLYERCTATEWVPIEFVTKLAQAAAPKLFPDSAAPLVDLGRALAIDNMGGVYAYLVRVLTVEFLMKQSARLWRTYHDAGRPTIERKASNTLDYVIFEYRDMPDAFRIYGGGFIQQLIVMTGAQNVEVVPYTRDDDDWGYTITWSSGG